MSYNQFQGYKYNADSVVASAALKVLRRHLWYILAPETVVLSLCSSHVDSHVK